MVIKEALDFGKKLLKEAGIDDHETDSFLLLEAVTGLRKTQYLLSKEQELDEGKWETYKSYLLRRAAHEPCQYIIGNCEFYGLSFLVSPKVLIPRQDTEVLVEEALSHIPKKGRGLDLCTGSGAVAIAIAHSRPDIDMTATDLSADALELAEENSKRNGCRIEFRMGDLFQAVDPDAKFDLIVSNPPYISDEEYKTLMPEVKDFEPELALKAGKEGLDVYQRLVRKAPEFLNGGGWLLVEIGCFQGPAVSELMEKARFEEIKIIKDLAGLDRVVAGRK